MDQTKAIALVQDYLLKIAQPGCTHSIAGIREHPDMWSIAVQPFRPDGQPFYDLMGFDVLKQTGEVRHML